MIDAEIKSRLFADAGVSAIVADRIYPMAASQTAAMPFVRWQRISRSQIVDQALDGVAGPVSARVQVDAYAGSYTQARQLADAVNACLETWGDPVEGTVRNVILDSERDLDESDDKVRRARVSQDWIIIFDH